MWEGDAFRQENGARGAGNLDFFHGTMWGGTGLRQVCLWGRGYLIYVFRCVSRLMVLGGAGCRAGMHFQDYEQGYGIFSEWFVGGG